MTSTTHVATMAETARPATFAAIEAYSDPAPAAASTDDLTAWDRDALVLRAIAARLRARPLSRTLRRLADLDAGTLDDIAEALEQEYTA